MGLATVPGRAGRAGESIELCNKEVAQSPSQGRLAVQGRARFSTRSSSHYTNAFMGGLQPHKIPSKETTPALPDSESYPGMEASLIPGKILNAKDTHLCSWTHGLTAQKDLRPVLLDCSLLLYPQFASSLGSDLSQTAQVHS